MEKEKDAVWTGRPWVAPSIAIRTFAFVVGGFLALTLISALGSLTFPILEVPLFIWVLGILGLAWLVSVLGLLILRASYTYVLRQSSIEVNQGIVRKRFLVVSPSAFSELETDQGMMGRMLNYGSLEVRSQGGQQLNLILIRDPKGVSAKIRDVMTVPTVRIAKDERAVAPITS
jgi:membrane protein YdbS with pleckstrin-like domain